MSGYVFELSPDSFLVNSDPYTCNFLLHKTNLPKGYQDLYLIGDVFLRNYYSVFDYDNEQIGLGLNIHAEGSIKIYKA